MRQALPAPFRFCIPDSLFDLGATFVEDLSSLFEELGIESFGFEAVELPECSAGAGLLEQQFCKANSGPAVVFGEAADELVQPDFCVVPCFCAAQSDGEFASAVFVGAGIRMLDSQLEQFVGGGEVVAFVDEFKHGGGDFAACRFFVDSRDFVGTGVLWKRQVAVGLLEV